MPIAAPTIDDRRYQDLLDEALARIPVHNPEWTNFNRSDPGITLVELFAFLTENLLYRANQIPERNRRKFLSLLGVPLQPAESARGLVTSPTSAGLLDTVTLNAGAGGPRRRGAVPHRLGLDVLPVEARVYYKRPRPALRRARDIYHQLYASFLIDGIRAAARPRAVRDRPARRPRPGRRRPRSATPSTARCGSRCCARSRRDRPRRGARRVIAGRTLSLGVVPVVADPSRTLPPAGTASAAGRRPPGVRRCRMSRWRSPAGRPGPARAAVPLRDARREPQRAAAPGRRPDRPARPAAACGCGPTSTRWRTASASSRRRSTTPARRPGGHLAARSGPASTAQARLLWAGINAAMVVPARPGSPARCCPDGTGEPDQAARWLSAGPARLCPCQRYGADRGLAGGEPPATDWQEIADLLDAGPEVPVPDPRLPPGSRAPADRADRGVRPRRRGRHAAVRRRPARRATAAGRRAARRLRLRAGPRPATSARARSTAGRRCRPGSR